MFWLPPLSVSADFDIGLLCDRLLLIEDLEKRCPGATDAIVKRERHATNWSVGDKETRLEHLKRKLSRLYHPDNYAKEPELSVVFTELTKHINQEIEAIESDVETAGTAPDSPYATSENFRNRFNRKSTVQTTPTLKPIALTLTLSQLYNQEEVPVPDTDSVLKCDGDLLDNSHKIVGGRQVMIRIADEPNAKKDGLDYIATVLTNPVQLLYFTHKVTLPDGQEVSIKVGAPLEYDGLGFTGKQRRGKLIVEYKVSKMPMLSLDIRKRLHEINSELFYPKK